MKKLHPTENHLNLSPTLRMYHGVYRKKEYKCMNMSRETLKSLLNVKYFAIGRMKTGGKRIDRYALRVVGMGIPIKLRLK